MADTDTRADDGGGYTNVKTVPDDEGIENNTTPEPSVDGCTNKTVYEEDISDLGNSGGGVTGKVTCMKNKDGMCVTHKCKMKTIHVTSKKWKWINRKKEYGYVSTKVKKDVCMNQNIGRVDPDISTDQRGSNS